uniref:THAP-type domain-containing protein n=1 Tax=Pectinophora gossypiella TaxID=13191 RepID=A0A1E1WQ08_PECGO
METERKKNKRYCLARGCVNSDKKMPNLSFFSLPKDAERRRKWLTVLNRQDILSKEDIKIKSYVVCSMHFDDSVVKITKQLKADAVPSIFLPNTLKNIDSSDVQKMNETITSIEAQAAHATLLIKRKLGEEPVDFEIKRSRVDDQEQKVTIEIHPIQDQNTPNASDLAENFSQRFRKLIEWQKKSRNGINGKQLTKEFKMFALNLHYSSPDAYRCLQTILKLPKESTLKKIKLKMSGELNDQVLQSLELKLKSLPSKAKYCTVCVGEMPLQPNLCYDIKTDEVIGLHHINDRTLPQFASNVLVVMLQGMFYNWKQPIAYSLVAGKVDYEELDLYLYDVIAKLLVIGVEVKAIVTKQDPYFEKFAKDIKKITNKKPYLLIGEHKVYYIFDVPHLLTCTRNNLLSNNFDYEGNVISWDYIQSLYEFQKEKNLQLIHKLSDAHLQPNKMQRTEVRYAAQVFSNTVYAALETYIDFDKIPAEAKATAKFVKAMNDIFDVLNSSNVDSVQNAFKMTPQQKATLEEAEAMFSNMKYINRDSTKARNPDHVNTFLNFQFTIQSIQLLFQDLRKEGFKYLFTGRLNQDCLENLFSCIRQQSGSSTNLTPVQFTRTFSNLFIQNMLKRLPTTYCKADIQKILVKAENLINITADIEHEDKSLILVSGYNDYRMDLPEENSVVYIASYLVFKCSMIHACEEMVEVLASLEPLNQLFPHFTEYNKTAEFYGYLKMPPEALIQYVEELEGLFVDHFIKCIQDKPGSTIFEFLRRILPILLCSCFPIDYFIRLFLRLRIFETMKLNNRSLTKNNDPIEQYLKVT